MTLIDLDLPRTGSRFSAPRDPHGSFIDETIGIVARQTRDIVSFAVGSPAPEALALVGAAELARDVIEQDGPAALSYGITEGDPELREIIAQTARDRGLAASGGDVIVTAGALQAIDLVCRVLIRPGDLVVVETPGFTNALAAFRNHGARLLEVPVDDEGLVVAEAARALRSSGERPRLFFVVPNFQNPSGVTLSLRRREELLALAAETGALIVEDDPYAELRYRGSDLPPLAALAPTAGVISIGSFSKVFLPGLRVGWAIADDGIVRRMAAAKQALDSSTSSLGQRMAVEFARRGRPPQHIAQLREIYKKKQDRARAALTRSFGDVPDLSWSDPDGGFYFWIDLPRHVSARRLFDAALEEGVAFVPGDAFGIVADHSSSLRFSISAPTPDRIDLGVARLRRAFDRVA